jgi:hypothetical protein
VILADGLESQQSRLNLQLLQASKLFIIILGVSHASGIKSSKLESVVHLLVLLGHILREKLLSVVKEDCIVDSKDESLGYGFQILKLWDGFLISLERLIENPEIINFPLLEQLLKRFQMLLQLIIIQRHSRIVSVNGLSRLEACRLFLNIIEIGDEVQVRLNLLASSTVQISIETN